MDFSCTLVYGKKIPQNKGDKWVTMLMPMKRRVSPFIIRNIML